MAVKLWIFDMDGTLANLDHRKHLVRQKPKNWKEFNRRIPLDGPIVPVLRLLDMVHHSFDDFVIVSGRGEESRQATVKWVLENSTQKSADYVNERLFMRRAHDFRCDSIVKKEIFDQVKEFYNKREEEFTVMGVFDDRPRVVKMWREMGLFVFDVNQTGEDF